MTKQITYAAIQHSLWTMIGGMIEVENTYEANECGKRIGWNCGVKF